MQLDNRNKLYRRIGKRLLDLILAVPAVILLLPLFIIIGIFIKLDSAGPIIYRQLRIGKNKKEFYILKFRTMVIYADKIGPKSTMVNDNRVTKVGRVLRKLSLDELPQLINVFLGDMSIVGYRPGLKDHYTNAELESNMFMEKPGITGYAQVMGRSSLNSDEKRALELKYIKEISLITDIKIIMLTIIKVIKLDSAY